MNSRVPRHLLSTVGLTVLALAAGGLSVAAITQNRTTVPVVVPSVSTGTNSPQQTPSPQQSNTPASPNPTIESTPGDSQSPLRDNSVVIVGDGNSIAAAPNLWVGDVSAELEWGPVMNLSASGRGYIKKPSSCDLAVCSTFQGTIEATTAENPDVVVTFGGTADGDQDLTAAAKDYFAALRKALPDAQLIAVSPVTSKNEAAYWLTLHSRTIRAGVEAVGGTFIDVGQPGVGDGDQLSAAAQDEVAQEIIAALS